MTSFDDSTTAYFEDSGIGDDISSTTSTATVHRDRDDIEQEKRHARRLIKVKRDFINEMIYIDEGESDEDPDPDTTSTESAELEIKRLKSKVADLHATCEAIFYEREEYRRESEAIKAQLPQVIKSKAQWHTHAMTLHEVAWAMYEGRVADEDEADHCEKSTKELSKELHVEEVKREMLTHYFEGLQEEKEMLEKDVKNRDEELKNLHGETKFEHAHQTGVIKEVHVACYRSKKEAHGKLKKIVEQLREEVAQLLAKKKEFDEKLEVNINDRTDELTSLKKEIAWLAETLAEKLLEIEELKALVAAESDGGAVTYFMLCQNLEAELAELKAQDAKYNKLINDANWKADEAESRANLIVKNRYPTLKVGDSADQTAKNLLTWTSFGSVNNVNKSERLSFDPVNHGPRDDVSFRPDQSTHYDTKSASFCNSPKSNRQRPSSVSSQFKSVLRSCMNQLPRSNSASRVLNRSLIS